MPEYERVPAHESPEAAARAKAALEVQLNWLTRYIASIIIGTPAAPDETPLKSGSGVIVRTQDDLFLLTANHVLNWFEKRRAATPGLSFQVGKLNLDMDASRRIWRDSDDDVAAIAVSDSEASAVGTDIHNAPEWPPAIPQHNDFVTITGLPVMRRTRPSGGTVFFGPMLAHLPVLGSFMNHFTCQIDRDYLETLSGRPLPGTEPVEYGGMSGGPVFLNSSLHYPLVGIVKEIKPDLEYFVIRGLRGVPSRVP
jgi:hypothetical protein